MSDAGAHIAAWEAAGLIDGATADRLREAEAAEEADVERLAQPSIDEPAATVGRSGASSLYGPAPRISEVFGYLGAGFLLTAWFASVARVAIDADDPTFVFGIGWGLAAVALIALGVVLHRGDDRRRRAAGVVFLVALVSSGAAAGLLGNSFGIAWPALGVFASAEALAISIALRRYHPAVLTQIGCLVAFTSFAGLLSAWLEGVIFPSPSFQYGVFSPGTNPGARVVLPAAWWLACAILLGAVGVWESRAAERGRDASAARRAGVSRLWAGLVAVIGLATAVSRSAFLADGSFGRVLEPWIGDLALLIASGVLIERAFRRESSSYVYAASVGLILALSDFNFSYLSDTTETALFAEGLILLGAGVAADRLRRRVGRRGDPNLPSVTGDLHPVPG